MFDKKAYPENCLRENAGKCPDLSLCPCRAWKLDGLSVSSENPLASRGRRFKITSFPLNDFKSKLVYYLSEELCTLCSLNILRLDSAKRSNYNVAVNYSVSFMRIIPQSDLIIYVRLTI